MATVKGARKSTPGKKRPVGPRSGGPSDKVKSTAADRRSGRAEPRRSKSGGYKVTFPDGRVQTFKNTAEGKNQARKSISKMEHPESKKMLRESAIDQTRELTTAGTPSGRGRVSRPTKEYGKRTVSTKTPSGQEYRHKPSISKKGVFGGTKVVKSAGKSAKGYRKEGDPGGKASAINLPRTRKAR